MLLASESALKRLNLKIFLGPGLSLRQSAGGHGLRASPTASEPFQEPPWPRAQGSHFISVCLRILIRCR